MLLLLVVLALHVWGRSYVLLLEWCSCYGGRRHIGSNTTTFRFGGRSAGVSSVSYGICSRVGRCGGSGSGSGSDRYRGSMDGRAGIIGLDGAIRASISSSSSSSSSTGISINDASTRAMDLVGLHPSLPLPSLPFPLLPLFLLAHGGTGGGPGLDKVMSSRGMC